MADTMHHIAQSATDRDRHDAGQAGSAWRWFSARTMRRASRYRDLTWRHVGRHMIFALAIILVSRIWAGEAHGVLLLVIGSIWAVLMARIAFIKSFDALTRQRRARS
ncbi:MAG TPA: hypothetical protein DF715_13025 [Oceanicaulis sp.]|jgi:hypothetical protein|nr:hypothetical protein [Oceanicaulis sp.]